MALFGSIFIWGIVILGILGFFFLLFLGLTLLFHNLKMKKIKKKHKDDIIKELASLKVNERGLNQSRNDWYNKEYGKQSVEEDNKTTERGNRTITSSNDKPIDRETSSRGKVEDRVFIKPQSKPEHNNKRTTKSKKTNGLPEPPTI